MRVASIDRSPAEMIAEPGRVRALYETLEALEMFGVGVAGRAEVHRDSVLHHLVLIENLVEDLERTAAIDHVVFRDDLKPVDDRLPGQDVAIVRNAKADSDSVLSKAVKAICGHEGKLRHVEVVGPAWCAGPEAKRKLRSELGRMLGAVGRAAALALAAVLAFAAIVASLAATLAFAIILTLT